MRPVQELTQNLFHDMTADSFSIGVFPPCPCGPDFAQSNAMRTARTCRNTHLQNCRSQWKFFNPCWGCLVIANPSKRTLWHRDACVELPGRWHHENSDSQFPLPIFPLLDFLIQTLIQTVILPLLTYLQMILLLPTRRQKSTWTYHHTNGHHPRDVVGKADCFSTPCESSWMAAVINPEARWLIQ